MERREQFWFAFLILVAVAFNVVTLTPVIPWQKWLLWSRPTPMKSFSIEMEDYEIRFPKGGMTVNVDEPVEFAVTSKDVTYGFGVFRPDGTLLFQFQVLPWRVNRFVWQFDAPSEYDIRSTEYSGPRHPEMYVKGALRVEASRP